MCFGSTKAEFDSRHPEIMKKKIFNNVFFVGLLSFFGGISQDIFLPVLPLYLSGILGFSASFIGITEGLVVAASSIFKIAAGFLSDKFKKQKPIVFAGYFLSMIGRLLLAVVSGGAGIMALRFIDGAGKGVKDPPKDVLIAESTKIETRGRGFGIVRALDTLGSVAGPLLLFALFYFLKDGAQTYKYIFLIAALPLLITFLILWFFVEETPPPPAGVAISKGTLPKSFYIFLIISAVFALGNFSSAFLILRARNVGVAILAIPLVYALFNFFYASASVPLGSLSDKIGREKVIILGWLAFVLAYLGFGFAAQPYQIWILFMLYGIYYASIEGVAKAFVADLTPSGHRGKAYGLYNTVIGVMSLPSGLIAGFLWDKYGAPAPFFFGAGAAMLAVFFLILFLALTRSKINYDL